MAVNDVTTGQTTTTQTKTDYSSYSKNPYQSGSGITISGLGNGTDFTDMIQQLKKIEMRHMVQLSAWRDDWQTRLESFQGLRTQLSEYSAFMKKMNNESSFLVKKATSSDAAMATASCGTEAYAGVYNIETKQLALAGSTSTILKVSTTGEPLSTTASTFKYAYAGAEIEVDVPENTSLAGLVNAINKDKNNPGVRASLMKSGENYILQLASTDTGKGTDVEVTDAPCLTGRIQPVTDQGGTTRDWISVESQNAMVRINGLPPTTWLESESNTIELSEKGVRITVLDAQEGKKTTITVENDTKAMKENIEKFVEETNKVLAAVKKLTSVNSLKTTTQPGYAKSQLSSQKGGTLTGNYGVQLLNTKLNDIIMGKAAGFDYLDLDTGKGDVFSSLAQLGIKTDTKEGSPTFGELLFEDNQNMITLDKALEKFPEEVAQLFCADKSKGLSDSPFFDVASIFYGDNTKGGSYDVQYTVTAAPTAEDPNAVMVTGTINGKPATWDGKSKQFTGDNVDGNGAAGVALQIYNLTPGDYTGQIKVREGKFDAICKVIDVDLLDPWSVTDDDPEGALDKTKGTISILERQYQEIIKTINDKIVREDERIAKWEVRTKLRFSRLDATLKKYDLMNGSIESSLKSLTTSKSS